MALLNPDVRRDPTRLSVLLRDDFLEIGQSGRRWTRSQIIEELDAESGASDVDLSERESLVVAPGLVRLTYVLDYGGSMSRRSSWWQREGAVMRCFFHQGTPMPSAAP